MCIVNAIYTGMLHQRRHPGLAMSFTCSLANGTGNGHLVHALCLMRAVRVRRMTTHCDREPGLREVGNELFTNVYKPLAYVSYWI